MKEITKIVLTGGPCSGKSSSINAVREHFTELGFKVLVVSEVVTDMFDSGLCTTDIDNIAFHCLIIKSQRFRELIMEAAAQQIEEEKVLIICDRGQMDSLAYITDEDFSTVKKILNTNIVEMRDGYDAVFHLMTSAKMEGNIYSDNVGNNLARLESDKAAVLLDDLILRAWNGHKHLRIIKPFTDFNAKVAKLIAEIEGVVCRHKEIEYAYIIERPEEKLLQALPFCHPVKIEQCYINTSKQSFRIRKRGESGVYTYCATEKSDISGLARDEFETVLTEEEYNRYRASAEAILEKTRYLICYEDKYFELDVYPFSDKYARLEIEVLDENEEFDLPPFLRIIKEVTGDSRYSNAMLAITHSFE